MMDEQHIYNKHVLPHANQEKCCICPRDDHLSNVLIYNLGPLLLTWFNLNPSMDK